MIQLATLKGRGVTLTSKDEVVLAADTVFSFNGRIFEKPKSRPEAYEMIASLRQCTRSFHWDFDSI